MKQSVRTPDGGTVRTVTHNLDATGNRTSVTGGSNAGTYSLVNPSPLQVHEYASTPLESFTRKYDANGNYLGEDDQASPQTGANITYDIFNRMTDYAAPVAANSAKYVYDALGRRIEKTVDPTGTPVTTRYLYHGSRVIEEVDTAGAVQASYVYGNYVDEVLSMQRGGVDYFYHADDMFNVMKVTDNAGAVVESYQYDAYGAPSFFDSTGATLTASAIGNPYLFTGRRYDDETDYYYYRARYMDPETGRFTARDPIGIWGDLAARGKSVVQANARHFSRYPGAGPQEKWALFQGFATQRPGKRVACSPRRLLPRAASQPWQRLHCPSCWFSGVGVLRFLAKVWGGRVRLLYEGKTRSGTTRLSGTSVLRVLRLLRFLRVLRFNRNAFARVEAEHGPPSL